MNINIKTNIQNHHLESDININMDKVFLKNPTNYLKYLKKLKSLLKEYPEKKEQIKQIVNYKDSYETWYSPPIFWPLYCVGKRSGILTLPETDWEHVFGGTLEMDNQLGIEITKLLLELGADPEAENYYGENFLDIIENYDDEKGKLTYRTDNEVYRGYVYRRLIADIA